MSSRQLQQIQETYVLIILVLLLLRFILENTLHYFHSLNATTLFSTSFNIYNYLPDVLFITNISTSLTHYIHKPTLTKLPSLIPLTPSYFDTPRYSSTSITPSFFRHTNTIFKLYHSIEYTSTKAIFSSINQVNNSYKINFIFIS